LHNVKEYVAAGGLMSWGASNADLFRRGGDYDRLLARCLGIHAPSLLPLKKFPKQRLLLPIAHHIVALLRSVSNKVPIAGLIAAAGVSGGLGRARRPQPLRLLGS
jgi:hypothetical protein